MRMCLTSVCNGAAADKGLVLLGLGVVSDVGLLFVDRLGALAGLVVPQSDATSVDASYNASSSLTGTISSATGRRLGSRLFTESHAVCIGAVLAGLAVCIEAGMAWLAGAGSTGRTLLSGDLVRFGVSTGAPTNCSTSS